MLLEEDRPGAHQHPAPDTLVLARDKGLIVGIDIQLEVGRELELPLEKPPRRHLAAAGRRFDDALGEARVLLRLAGDDEAHAWQAGDVRRRVAGAA